MDTRISNFTFGVELELHLPRAGQACVAEVANLISAAIGKPCEFQGYNHRVSTGWKIVTDGSLQGAGTTAWEFVSPILKGEAGLNELKTVLETLTAFGATVGTDCGTHVHIGVGQNPNVDMLKRLLKAYQIFEPAIDSIMPPSRRGNNAFYVRTVTTIPVSRIDAVRDWRDLLRLFPHERYHKINFWSIPRYGTIEFRQHSGTIEFEKLSNWITFMMRLIASAQDGTIAVPASAGEAGAPQVNRARYGSKSYQIGQLLLRPEGCTAQEAMTMVGWPSVSMVSQARICGLQLVKERTGRSMRFFARAVASSTQIEAGPATLERLLSMVRATLEEISYFTNRRASLAARVAARAARIEAEVAEHRSDRF